MNPEKALVVFQGKQIRRTWHNNEWWFVVEDIVFVLTDSKDPKQYINKMRKRDEELSKGWVQFVHTLSVPTSGGSQRIIGYCHLKEKLSENSGQAGLYQQD
tara:strand:- start:1402 stop:1704 length:303 start_codon:yes stop_codon:yes gene_type:complete